MSRLDNLREEAEEQGADFAEAVSDFVARRSDAEEQASCTRASRRWSPLAVRAGALALATAVGASLLVAGLLLGRGNRG